MLHTFLTLLFTFSMAQDKPPAEPPYPGSVQEKSEKIQIKETKMETRELKSWVPPSHEGVIVEGTKFRGTKRIQHPFANEGLYRITKDGEYIYKIKPSDMKNSASFKIGSYFPENLANPDYPDLTFDTIYTDTDGLILIGDYEWRIWSGFGKLGLKYGSGIFFASGQGRFANGEEAQERYTLIMIPNTLSAILYLQFWDKQPIIPYAEAGGDLYVFNESRDDSEPPLGRWGGAYAGHVAGGAMINLGIFDWRGLIRLDQEYGINNIYLTVEYRVVSSLGGTFDFSSTFWNGGVMVEF